MWAIKTTTLKDPAIKALIKNTYDRLPGKIKPCFTPLQSGYHKFKQVYLPVFLFSGETKASGFPFTFAYVGMNSNQQSFWSTLILGSAIEKSFSGNHFAFNIPTLLRRSHPQCAMILWEDSPVTTAYFSNQPTFRIPRWIKMEIDISLPIDRLCRGNSGYKDIKRRIKKHNYTYSVTREPGDREYFYNHMYVPYIKSRFVDTDIVLPKSTIFDENTSTDLLFVKKSETVVAGAVVKHESGKAAWAWLGIVHGNFDHVREGALGAAYYFVIAETQSKGFARLDIGYTRPIMNDGVTQYKLRLLARADRSCRSVISENTLMIFSRDTPGLRDFLAHNQIIYLAEDDKLISTSWIQPEASLSKHEFQAHARRSLRAGLDGHCFFLFGAGCNPAKSSDLAQPGGTIKQAGEYFLRY